MNKLFSADPFLPKSGLAIIRIIIGCFLVYHGFEIFDKTIMDEYITRDVFKKLSSPSLIVYFGKALEFIAGFLLAIGLLTRVACLIIIGTFIYIPFFVGNGKIFYEDQHPFLFALFGGIFFFTGPGKWSVDSLLFQKKRSVTY